MRHLWDNDHCDNVYSCVGDSLFQSTSGFISFSKPVNQCILMESRSTSRDSILRYLTFINTFDSKTNIFDQSNFPIDKTWRRVPPPEMCSRPPFWGADFCSV